MLLGRGEGCGCLTEASVCFYPTLFGVPGNLPRVEMFHTQHIAPKFERFPICAALFSHCIR